MAPNKKKIFITESMSQPGRALLNARDDIDLIEFPNMISQADFNAKLKEHAPVHGVALGGTRFGDTELESSKDMLVVTRIGVGFDAVDVPALSRRKVPLMVAGTANSPSVAECAMFMMLTLAKRASEMHSIVVDNKWPSRLGALRACPILHNLLLPIEAPARRCAVILPRDTSRGPPMNAEYRRPYAVQRTLSASSNMGRIMGGKIRSVTCSPRRKFGAISLARSPGSLVRFTFQKYSPRQDLHLQPLRSERSASALGYTGACVARAAN